jgi:hypothetical protein
VRIGSQGLEKRAVCERDVGGVEEVLQHEVEGVGQLPRGVGREIGEDWVSLAGKVGVGGGEGRGRHREECPEHAGREVHRKRGYLRLLGRESGILSCL